MLLHPANVIVAIYSTVRYNNPSPANGSWVVVNNPGHALPDHGNIPLKSFIHNMKSVGTSTDLAVYKVPHPGDLGMAGLVDGLLGNPETY